MKNIFWLILAFSNFSFSYDVIVSNKDHYITKDNLGGYIELSIEFLTDFENNFDGKYPNIDFAAIYFDVNGNSVRDADIDRFYSLIGSKRMCSGVLLDDRATRPCGSYNTKAKVFVYFIKSERQPMPHPIVKYLIPTDELFINGDYAYVVFQLYSKGAGYSSYPGEERFKDFKATIRLKK
jgi:hypothetical protein